MAPAQPELDSSLQLFAFQVHDYVRDRHREAFAGAAHDALLEPVRAPLGMGRDDDLVRAERSERVFDRLERLAVADLAARLEARLPQSRQAAVEPLLRGVSRLVLVRHPMLE